MIEVSTDHVEVYLASADEHGEIIIEDENGQRVLVLTSPEAEPVHGTTMPVPQTRPPQFGEAKPLFEQLAEVQTSDTNSRSMAFASGSTTKSGSVHRPAFSYRMREGLPVPKRLRTEKCRATSRFSWMH